MNEAPHATCFYSLLASPIGELLLTSDGDSLTRVSMPLERGKPAPEPKPSWRRDDAASALRQARDQLRAYFAGELFVFDLPLSMAGTPFQRRVWQGLLEVPFGATWSYAELARHVGHPGASRAVGAANGRNPIAIIVPCHRVIGANGTLTGYGGGLERKKWLLDHETGAMARFSATERVSRRRVAGVSRAY